MTQPAARDPSGEPCPPTQVTAPCHTRVHHPSTRFTRAEGRSTLCDPS